MRRATFSFLVMLTVAGCATVMGRFGLGPADTVSGTLIYRQRVTLPPTAAAHVRLVELPDLDAATGSVIAETRIADPGQLPIDFVLDYPVYRTEPSGLYGIEATVTLDGSTPHLVTAGPHFVLTGGHGNEVEVLLVPARGTTLRETPQ